MYAYSMFSPPRACHGSTNLGFIFTFSGEIAGISSQSGQLRTGNMSTGLFVCSSVDEYYNGNRVSTVATSSPFEYILRKFKGVNIIVSQISRLGEIVKYGKIVWMKLNEKLSIQSAM